MAVVFLERLADGSGLLAAQRRALKLPPGWTIVDRPLDSLAGGPGGPGQVTGYLELVPPASPAFGGGFSLGSQDPPQYVAAVSSTVTLSSGTQVIGTVPVPAGKVVTFDLDINASIILPTPGILLAGAFDLFALCAAYGSSGAKVLGNPALDSGRSTTTSPWISTAVNLTLSGNTVSILAQAYTVPAFVSGTTYGGGLLGSTTLPNGIGDPACALVTNDSGKIYVCASGGTDSSSGGPTGTSAGAISVGGLTWYYVGPAASGVPCNITVTLNGIKTG